MENLIKKLKILGFNNYEARVYIGLLQFGTVKAGDLVKDLRLHREVVYTALQNLQEKGLVTIFTKNKISYYTASSPEILTSKFKNLLEQAKTLKPELEAFRKIEKEVVKTILGDEQLIMYLEELLGGVQPEDVFYIILGPQSSFAGFESLYSGFCDIYQSLKLKNKIKIITWDSLAKKISHLFPIKIENTVLPDLLCQPQNLIFTSSKVLSIFSAQEKVTLVLESKAAAENYVNYFKNLQSLSSL